MGDLSCFERFQFIRDKETPPYFLHFFNCRGTKTRIPNIENLGKSEKAGFYNINFLNLSTWIEF